MYDRLYRVLGVPLLCALMLFHYFGWNIWLVPSIIMMIGGISTYWKKCVDATFKHYYLHGLGISIALIPYCIATHLLLGCLLRIILLPLVTGIFGTILNRDIYIWKWKFRAVQVSESGRGFSILSSLYLLFI